MSTEAGQINTNAENVEAISSSTGLQTSKHEIESKVEEIEAPFRHFVFKRIQAINSLLLLIAISLLPLFLIGGSLCISPSFYLSANFQLRLLLISEAPIHIHGFQW